MDDELKDEEVEGSDDAFISIPKKGALPPRDDDDELDDLDDEPIDPLEADIDPLLTDPEKEGDDDTESLDALAEEEDEEVDSFDDKDEW